MQTQLTPAQAIRHIRCGFTVQVNTNNGWWHFEKTEIPDGPRIYWSWNSEAETSDSNFLPATDQTYTFLRAMLDALPANTQYNVFGPQNAS